MVMEDSNASDYSSGESYMYRVNISYNTPLDWALPLYGYVMPCLVAVTTVTNLFIVIVLSQKHLCTPTNNVLISMAITDLLTGWTSIPWFLYYYTLKGYAYDQKWGLSPFWCQAHFYSSEALPSVFHYAAIWLTVFLAVQRYVYVCVPNSVHRFCTPKTTKLSVLIIFMLSFFSLLPEILGKHRIWFKEDKRSVCVIQYAEWVLHYPGKEMFLKMHYYSKILLHSCPCLLLLIFTCKLGRTIGAAEQRKKSWAPQMENGATRRKSTVAGQQNLSTKRTLYATNRMLAMICSVFLLLEIPAAFLSAFHILLSSQVVHASDFYYDLLNRTLIIRNLLIVLTSPIQFGIYCSMSEQFRLTVRQLFTSRLLFVTQAQATFHGGKRYSLILVDVETTEKKQSFLRRSLHYSKKKRSVSSGPSQSRVKLTRQASIPGMGPREKAS